MEITLAELARLVGGSVAKGDPDKVFNGIASVEVAGPADITFFNNPRYLNALKESCAGAVLVPEGFDTDLPEIPALVTVANPSAAFGLAVARFGAPPRPFEPGVHPSAAVHPSARFDPEAVSVGPCTVIEADVVIGNGTSVGPGAVVCRGTKIGRDCILHANVTVREGTIMGDRVILQSGCVIGADGFGYDLADGKYTKIDQVGIVQLDDDVEVGACTTIDRARFGRTHIGEGSKLDNLVQIAHNCVVGKHTAAASQVGMAGSARVGDHVMLAGKSGVGGHVKVGNHIVVLGMAGVTRNIEEQGKYAGYPAVPLRTHIRSTAATRKIPDLARKIEELEAEVARLRDLSGPDNTQ